MRQILNLFTLSNNRPIWPILREKSGGFLQHQISLTRLRFILFTLLFIYPLIGFALPNDKNELLNIIANTTEFNYKTGVDIYEGNVKVNQGSSQLLADKVITKKNDKHKVISVEAYGIKKLAEYTTIPKKGELLFAAKAKIIKFYPADYLVILEEDVTINQGKNSFRGPIMIYHTKDQILKAPHSEKGHSTIIIEPTQIQS